MGKSLEEEIGVANEMGAGQHRQYESLELLKELDYYVLSVTMLLTAVSGLFIGGTTPCQFFQAGSSA